jgi:hypothetical protein
VVLSGLFIVGGPPIADALEAEGVIAVLEHTELPAVLEDLLEAYAALIVQLIYVVAVLVYSQLLGVHVLAAVAELAVALLVKFTHSKSVWVRKVQIYDGLVVFHELQLGFRDFTQRQLGRSGASILVVQLRHWLIQDIVDVVNLWVVIRLVIMVRLLVRLEVRLVLLHEGMHRIV